MPPNQWGLLVCKGRDENLRVRCVPSRVGASLQWPETKDGGSLPSSPASGRLGACSMSKVGGLQVKSDPARWAQGWACSQRGSTDPLGSHPVVSFDRDSVRERSEGRSVPLVGDLPHYHHKTLLPNTRIIKHTPPHFIITGLIKHCAACSCLWPPSRPWERGVRPHLSLLDLIAQCIFHEGLRVIVMLNRFFSR